MTRTLLITGASSGIGKAICEKMLGLGHQVIGISRSKAKLAMSTDRFLSIEMDLSQQSAYPDLVSKLLTEHPNLDALISCAGQGEFGSLEEFSYQQISQFVQTNLVSHLFLSRTLIPHFKTKKTGDIIFIGSDAALQGSKKGSLYCACKFALRGLTQSLRAECASSGVRVSIIHPGMTDTPFYQKLHFEPGTKHNQHLLAQDVADAVALIIEARDGVVFDEIQLSPLTKVVEFKKDNPKT